MAVKETEEQKRRRLERERKEKERKRIENSPQKDRQEAAGNTGVMIGRKAATPEDIERLNKKATEPARANAQRNIIMEVARNKQNPNYEISPEAQTRKDKDARLSYIKSQTGKSFIDPEDVRNFEAQEAEQQAQEAEIQRLIDEETPQKRELDPYVNKLETKPIVGEFLNEALSILARNIPFSEKLGFPQDGTGKLNYQPQPEELKTAILTEIERREIEAGLTDSEKFGKFAESVKLGELEKFIPGISEAEQPSGNVQNIVKSLRVLKTRTTDIESKIVSGKLTQSQANERIALIENELQVGESRIKLLIQNSPSLKVNSDGVNFIELKILETRERIQDAKIANVRGATRNPTDLEVLNDLQNAINNEDFNIPGLE